ncbi:MAG: HD domain-containing protein [Saprospiraceae bacterium]|nr:HD domain-containing protein [Saprospiraceae bacterium]
MRKILNDPVYGFISIPDELLFKLIEHPYFQRLRRIKQLGLTHLVYPGALHTRFHHAIGAMYLTNQAILVLKSKGQEITEEESQATLAAILLHDIGHGPFSHALESSLVCCMPHEKLSELFMRKLNEEFNGKLSLAIKIFRNEYPKKFLHQLISSQLDMDRLDFLKRDSFFTGVSEGVIGTERIIQMLNVVDDEIVVEAKGIYSIEKFIVARRLMYWQVYLHKTVISAEYMMVKVLQRAKCLVGNGKELFATPALKFFLSHNISKDNFDNEVLDKFAKLDDFDILTSIKVWSDSDDKILSFLCKSIINRKLYKIQIQNAPFEEDYIAQIKVKAKKIYEVDEVDVDYFVISSNTQNNAYNLKSDKINILYKNGDIMDIANASDQLNLTALATTVSKYFVCYPEDCRL